MCPGRASERIPHCGPGAALSCRQRRSSQPRGLVSSLPGQVRRCRAEAGAGSQVEQCLGRKVEAALLEVGVRRLTVPFLVDWSFLGFLRALFADNLLLSFLLHGLYMTESSD